jgi:hypothetical protein
MYSPEGSTELSFGFVISLLVFMVGILIIQVWSSVALMIAVKEKESGISPSDAYRRGLGKLWPFAVVTFLSSLVSAGGLVLFVIPAIIMSIWFVFAPFVLIEEDVRGLSALVKSRLYVKGWWGHIFGRLAILMLVVLVIAMGLGFVSAFVIALMPAESWEIVVDQLMQLLSYVIFYPITVLYMYNLFQNIKSQKSTTEVDPATYSKGKMVLSAVLGVLGLVVVPVALVALLVAVNPLEQINQAQDSERRATIGSLQIELEQYYLENDRYPPSLESLNVDILDLYENELTYTATAEGTTYTLCIKLSDASEECVESMDHDAFMVEPTVTE